MDLWISSALVQDTENLDIGDSLPPYASEAVPVIGPLDGGLAALASPVPGKQEAWCRGGWLWYIMITWHDLSDLRCDDVQQKSQLNAPDAHDVHMMHMICTWCTWQMYKCMVLPPTPPTFTDLWSPPDQAEASPSGVHRGWSPETDSARNRSFWAFEPLCFKRFKIITLWICRNK